MKLEESILKIILDKIKQKAAEKELTEEEMQSIIATYINYIKIDGINHFSTSLTDTLKKKMPEMLIEHREIQAAFEQRLQERWKKALDLYDTSVVIGREAGELCVKEHRAQAVNEKDLVFEVLMRIHVKACQTVSAIGILLKSGYARDALARHRTLHELSVTASFIAQHGQETAERYWEHNVIESCKIVKEHELVYERLGDTPYDPAYIEKLHMRKAKLIDKYGTVYEDQYGWAAHALGRKKGRVQFREIEKNVKLDHLRPYYQMASHGVHANIKGLLFDIGDIYKEKPGYTTMFLAGASDTGLADPGQLAVISFNQCTVSLLNLRPDLETVIKLRVLKSFVDATCQAFIEIHRELKSNNDLG